MRKYITALMVVMLSLLVVIGLGGCSSSDGTGAEVVVGDSAGQEADAPTEASDEAPATGEAGTRTSPLPVGTTARVGDWEITITDVNTDANDEIAAANEFNDPPADGSRFVLVTADAAYVGEESGTFWLDMTYKFYGSGGNTFDSASAVSSNMLLDAGETFPGASVSGEMVFEVPADQIDGGAIIMEDTFSFEDSRVFFALN